MSPVLLLSVFLVWRDGYMVTSYTKTWEPHYLCGMHDTQLFRCIVQCGLFGNQGCFKCLCFAGVVAGHAIPNPQLPLKTLQGAVNIVANMCTTTLRSDPRGARRLRWQQPLHCDSYNLLTLRSTDCTKPACRAHCKTNYGPQQHMQNGCCTLVVVAKKA